MTNIVEFPSSTPIVNATKKNTVTPMVAKCRLLKEFTKKDYYESENNQYEVTFAVGEEGVILGITNTDHYVVYFPCEDHAKEIGTQYVEIIND